MRIISNLQYALSEFVDIVCALRLPAFHLNFGAMAAIDFLSLQFSIMPEGGVFPKSDIF
jgi:hypothetical protein